MFLLSFSQYLYIKKNNKEKKTYCHYVYAWQAPRIVPLEDLLEDDEYPELSCLDLVVADKDLSHVADNKGEWQPGDRINLTPYHTIITP